MVENRPNKQVIELEETLVIVGAGIAAINAIKAIRETNKEMQIHLFSEEPYYPYSRIRLSKSMLENLAEDQILLQKKNWYDTNKVNLHLGKRVAGFNINDRVVILADETRVHFDKLLFCTGASNVIPTVEGISSKDVHTIRNLKDALDIRESIKDKDEILIIGGGIQGLETAWILSQYGKKVTVVELQSRLMPNQLDKESSSILMDAVEKQGIKVLRNTRVEKIYCDEEVKGIMTGNNEKVSCDMIIYSIGISPNIELFKGTAVELRRGIVVNDRMQTSVDFIYAAGDAVEYGGQITGLWNIAVEQGKTAGYNLAGEKSYYGHIVPVTTLNAFNLSLFSMGDVGEQSDSRSYISEDKDKGEYKRVFVRDNKVVGAIVIGDTRKSPLLKSAIEMEIPLEDSDLEVQSADILMERLKQLKEDGSIIQRRHSNDGNQVLREQLRPWDRSPV